MDAVTKISGVKTSSCSIWQGCLHLQTGSAEQIMQSTKTLILIILFASASIPARSNAANLPCLPSLAVADADSFQMQYQADHAKNTQALDAMAALTSKIKDKNRSIASQLTVAELQRFNDARHQLIAERFAGQVVSDYVRDVHIVAELLEVAEIDNLYGLQSDEANKLDPRLFYYTVLVGLRAMLPDPPAVKRLQTQEDGCVMHKAIVILEGFNMTEMAREPTNKGILNYILDIRRIGVLLDLSSKTLEYGISDSKTIKWNGDVPTLALGYDKWLATQNQSVQLVSNKVVPFINASMPSKMHLKTTHDSKVAAGVIADGPALKQ